MIADFRALGYLESRQLVNLVRRTLKQPGRLIMYALAALYFGGMVFLRTQTRAFGGSHGITEPLASGLGFGAIAMIGGACLAAAVGRVSAFSSIADARFLIDSKLAERNVLVWLQLRSSWRMMARFLLLALLYTVIFPKAGTAAGMIFSIVGLTALASAFNVPIMRLRRSGFATAVQVGAIVLIACAVGCAAVVLAPFVAPAFWNTSVTVQHWGLGRIVTSLLGGNWHILGAIWVAALCGMTLSYLGSTDLYPELYAASLKSIEFDSRRKRNPFVSFSNRAAPAATVGEPARSARIPQLGGAWTMLWKEWVTFRRVRGAKWLFVLSMVAAAIAGAGIGIFARQSSHDNAVVLSISLGASLGNIVLVFMALSSSVALSEDLRKPMWWLSAANLRARLYVWTLAASWRLTTIAAIAFIAWSIVLGAAAAGAAAVLLGAVLIVFVRSIGLALYSLFPSKLDQRGPVAMVRLLLMYLLLIPAIGTGVTTGILLRSLPLGLLVAVLVAITEGVLLVEFAAFRIAGVGAGIAQAEEA